MSEGVSRASSVAKGSAFEDRVFGALEKELAEDRLGLSPRTARIFRKKSYYSRDRDAQVVVDISIEVWLPKATHWSLLWVAECKDYSNTVPVCDVEEFKSKLDQIAGINKKGVLVVSSALQRSALNYARTHGIAVVRLLAEDRIRYVLHELSARETADDLDDALTLPHFTGTNRYLYAEADGRSCANWRAILRRSLWDACL